MTGNQRVKDIKVPRQYTILNSQDKALKEKAGQLDISVSQLIRRIINKYLGKESNE